MHGSGVSENSCLDATRADCDCQILTTNQSEYRIDGIDNHAHVR